MKLEDCKFTNIALNDILAGEYDVRGLEPKTILDIGANEGAFTAWARERWPEAYIEAYEPIPENLELLKQNVGADGKVKVQPFAVCDAVGSTVTMRYGIKTGGECSRYDLGEQNGKQINVPFVHPKHITPADLVKIDTEGCEVEILSGLDLSRVQAVVCEYHRAEDAREIEMLCERNGLGLIYHHPCDPKRGILKFLRGEKSESPRANQPLGQSTKGKSILVAMPIYKYVDYFTVVSLMKAMMGHMTSRDWSLAFDFHPGECPIGRCRNDLTHTFLQNKEFTHILFIDSDIIFSHEQIERILSHDEDIVGGIYTKKQDGPVQPVLNTLYNVDQPNAKGLIKAKYMGTGFLRISRRVFEVMITRMGEELMYVDDGDGKTVKYDFWRMGVGKHPQDKHRRWLSEDWQFCQFALDCGFDVWADLRVLVQHQGLGIFPTQSQLAELFNPDALKRQQEFVKAQASATGGGCGKPAPATQPLPTL